MADFRVEKVLPDFPDMTRKIIIISNDNRRFHASSIILKIETVNVDFKVDILRVELEMVEFEYAWSMLKYKS